MESLVGDALAGETERLRGRVAQLYSRIETQLKQVIREAEIRENLRPTIDAGASANLPGGGYFRFWEPAV